MGCCPIFRNNAKVTDIASTLGHEVQLQNSQGCAQIRKVQNVEPPPTIQVSSPELQQPPLSNNTQHQFRPPSPAADLQSNLDIAVSASADNQQQLADSVAFEPHQQPTMILLAHSKIRQSLAYRWQQPQFNVDQLFKPINYDRLFTIDVQNQQKQPAEVPVPN